MIRIALYIIVGLLVIIIGVGIGLFFFMQTNPNEVPAPIRDFFPFGSEERTTATDTSAPADTAAEEELDQNENAPLPVLRKLHSEPVSGLTIFEAADTTAVRFVERASGHVFEIQESERSPRRITNTTVPRVQEALFAAPETVVLRYFGDDDETLQTFVADIAAVEGDEGELSGTFLPPNALSLDLLDDRAFYTVAGEERGYVANLATDTAVSVLPVPFTEWLAEWISDDRVALTAKPSAQATGALYLLRLDTGSFERVLGNIAGLTTRFSSGASYVLVGASDGNTLSLNVLERDSGSLTSLPLRTLPEKCVWSVREEAHVYCAVPEQIPAGVYPDDWYQGRVSFSDSIWSIDVIDGTTELIAQPQELSREPIDVVHPTLAPDESLLVFMNKKDGTPWMLELLETSGEDSLLDE